MKIAMIGTRGVPANYGGFETCVEELGKRLVERGHEITVYCRNSYYKTKLDSYCGIKLVYLPNLKKKSLDTLSHTFLSVLHASTNNFDVIMVFNAANSPTLFLPRLLGRKIAINTDGLEWKRGKWGPVARKYYKICEWLSTRLAHCVVADSQGIHSYYKDTYGSDSTVIAYGAEVNKSQNNGMLRTLNLTPGEYFLQITRFEPENNPLLTIQSYRKLATDKKLVLVGGVPYQNEYTRQIMAEADDKVILPGFIYEKELLNELWCNCYAYVHGNEVGGTNPALLQSMANGCFVIAVDVSFSHDVLQNGGVFFQKTSESLADKMQWALDHDNELAVYKARNVQRIQEEYTWEKVADGYENLFRQLVIS